MYKVIIMGVISNNEFTLKKITFFSSSKKNIIEENNRGIHIPSGANIEKGITVAHKKSNVAL